MSARPLMLKVVAACFCVLGVGVFASVPAWAVRGHTFAVAIGSAGFGNGQFKEPVSVAVSESTGDVYVVDRGNNRVEYFGSSGGYLGQFNGSGLLFGEGKPAGGGGLTGEIPTGAFSLPEGIAVDNDPSSPSFGDVYVADVGHSVIDKYGPTGAYVGQITEGSGGSRLEEIEGLTVDSAGALWVYLANKPSLENKSIDSFTGALANEFLSTREASVFGSATPGFAVDSNDNLYVKTHFYGISKLNSSGGLLVEEFDSLIQKPNSDEVPSGVGVDLASNDVYIGDADGEHSVGRFSSSGSVIEKFGAEQLVYPKGLTVDSASKAVYVVDAASNVVDVFALEPPGAPGVVEEFASDVSGDSATLQAEVDPHGVNSEYHFEYVPCASAPTCVAPVPNGQLGADYEIHPVSLHLQGLRPSTVYHFRLVAHNQLGIAEGTEHTFTTQATGTSNALPDGRAWEMVSPPNKDGVGLETPMTELGNAMQASVNGGAVTYTANGPTEDQPQGNRAPEPTQLFSRRGAAGWGTAVITTPFSEVGQVSVGYGAEYQLFSADLSTAALFPFAQTTLSSEATEQTPYLRHDFTCDTSPATCYKPLVTVANVEPPGIKFGGHHILPVVGTPDLSHVILHSSEVKLLPGGIEGFDGTYEWSDGKLQLVTVLPDGTPAPHDGLVGYRDQVLRHAISEDGSRVVFEAETSEGGYPHLYTRDIVKGETVQVDAVEPGASGGPVEPRFQLASSDGSRVFFTDLARLTLDSTASRQTGKPDLYEFDVETGKLTDLTVDSNKGESANVVGLVQGASEDGSYVYFVASGVLAPGASPGHGCEQFQSEQPAGATCNLYVRHSGVTKFIATLSGQDQQWTNEAQANLEYVTARVAPDGRWFAFMSDRRLTGYDNRDANSGEADEEVYLYDASTNRLSCVSCNPTGARPAGMFETTRFPDLGPLVDRTDLWEQRWLAASLPGWGKVNLGASVYQSRYLSDAGRLFFTSNDALVPQDVNGVMDVYEFEFEGVGDCTSASATFDRATGGCVSLISSGGSGEESAFMDASENGNEVFFLTAAKLRPEDYDTALDVYDARVCTSTSPCLPVPPVSPPPCSTGDSCKPAPTPQPAIFGAAPSATFSGAGNVIAPTPTAVKAKAKPAKCRRGFVKRKRRCVRKLSAKRAAKGRQ